MKILITGSNSQLAKSFLSQKINNSTRVYILLKKNWI